MFEQKLRKIEKQPRLMRVLVLPLRWLRWVLFASILWLAVAILIDATRLSRSYLVTLAASLVTAWVVIAIAARLIRNRSIGKLFEYSAWTIAALYILGLLPQTVALLDQAAFTLGTFRLSLLVAIKALVLFSVLMWTASFAGDFFEHRIRAGSGLTPTAQVLLSKLVKTGLITLAFLATLTATGIDLTVLALFSGALGLGIGFGLQKVASNLISGIIILLDKSIKPGDVISLGDTFGWITSFRVEFLLDFVEFQAVECLGRGGPEILGGSSGGSGSDRKGQAGSYGGRCGKRQRLFAYRLIDVLAGVDLLHFRFDDSDCETGGRFRVAGNNWERRRLAPWILKERESTLKRSKKLR